MAVEQWEIHQINDVNEIDDRNSYKKSLSRQYNEVNKEIYGFGVRQLKTVIDGQTILYLVKHQRAMVLKAIEDRHAPIKIAADYAVNSEFKLQLKEKLEQSLGIRISAILRDYDPDTETAATLVVLA